jgi:predicted nuclease with TOPRIM domain
MKPKKVPRREEKDGQLDKLKNRVRNLEKENHRLKSELRTYEQAFKNTTKFLRDNTKEISLEKLIDAAKKGDSLKQVRDSEVKKTCKFCFSTNIHVGTIPSGKMIMCRDCSKTEVERNDRGQISEPDSEM